MTGMVLAAIDLTYPVEHTAILGRAKMVADYEKASLSVVTVIPDFGMSIVGTFFDEDTAKAALEEAGKALHAAVIAVAGEEQNRTVTHVVRHGSVYEEVLAAAGIVDATHIVIGAHRPNFSDFLLGPNAARVARHAKCSVYIVRD